MRKRFWQGFTTKPMALGQPAADVRRREELDDQGELDL